MEEEENCHGTRWMLKGWRKAIEDEMNLWRMKKSGDWIRWMCGGSRGMVIGLNEDTEEEKRNTPAMVWWGKIIVRRFKNDFGDRHAQPKLIYNTQ